MIKKIYNFFKSICLFVGFVKNKPENENKRKEILLKAQQIWALLNDNDKLIISYDQIPYSLIKIFSNGKDEVFYQLKYWVEKEKFYNL